MDGLGPADLAFGIGLRPRPEESLCLRTHYVDTQPQGEGDSAQGCVSDKRKPRGA